MDKSPRNCHGFVIERFDLKRLFKKKLKLKMKVFQRIQKQYAILGISASNQLTRTLPFSKRVLFGFLSISIEIFSQFVYTFHVANDYMTYIDCICATSTTILIFICLAAMVFRKSTLFEIIHEIEELIDTSEL